MPNGSAQERAEPGAKRSGTRRSIARAVFAPDLGASVAPLRESVGAFLGVVSAFRHFVGRRREDAGRSLRWPGWTGAVVVLGALAGGGYALVVLLKGVLLLVVPEAHGQEFALGPSDPKTRELLGFLFGIGRGEDAGVGDMLLYYNAAMTLIVAALLIYQVLFAVVETGRTGEGRLTGWQVMRCVLVVGLLFPLPATGLGPGQHLVLELSDLSGRIASGVWQRFAGVLVSGGSGAPVHIPPQHREMVTRLVLVETCMYVHNQVAVRAHDGPYITVQREEDGGEVRYLYQDPDPAGRHRPCGRVIVSTVPSAAHEGARIMARAHAQALRSAAFVGALERAAKEIGDRFFPDHPQAGEPLPEVNAWLAATGLVELYANALRGQVSAATAAARAAVTEEVREAVAREGWLGAASFFLVISRNQATFHDAVAAVPDVRVGGRWLLDAFDAVAEPWDEAEGVVAQWLGGSEEALESARAMHVEGESWWETLFGWFPAQWTTFLDPAAPLEGLVTMGHYMIGGGLTVFGVKGAVAVAGWPGFGGVAGKVAAAANQLGAGGGGIVRVAAVGMLVLGIALAYVLPIIPFIRFFFGVVAWVLSVIEALLALPLFLAMQVAGEERGLVTRASHGGYLLLLHAVVRPALMVFGLVLGYFLFVSGIVLLNWLYEAQLEGFGESGRLNVISFLVWFVIYAVLAYALANAAFKAVDVLPREVLGWLGGRVRAEGGESTAAIGAMRGSFAKLSALRGLGRGGR